MSKKYISFTALINDEPVRLTATIGDFEIISNDNSKSYDVERYADQLEGIEFQEVYDE
jgi:hypothetical protein